MPSLRRGPVSAARSWWLAVLLLVAGLLSIPASTALAAPTAVEVTPGGFVSVDATRLLDTRTSGGQVAAGDPVSVPVTGVAGVPDTGVSAVVLSVTATGSAADGFVIVGPSGAPTPGVSNVNYAAGQSASNLVVVKIGSDGQVALSVSSSTHVIVDITGFYTSGDPVGAGGFVPMDPNRLLDTRVGTGAPAQRVQAGSSVPLQVSGRGGVPASGVSAVVLNVTAVEPSNAGWVTVSASGSPVPSASNLNYAPGEVVPNLVMVQLGADGKAVLTANGAGSVDVLADVAGYFTDGNPVADGGFVPTAPSRALDTRSTTGGHHGIVSGGEQMSVSIAGVAGVPSTGVSAVVVNLTATQPTGNGFLTAHATDAPVPGTSNLNYSTDKSAAVLAIVPVGADGSITLSVQGAAQVHLIADVMGYIPAGVEPPGEVPPGVFASVDATRLLDTRTSGGPVASGSSVSLSVTGVAGVPTSAVSAVTLSVTATGSAADGFVIVGPSGAPTPGVSNVNYAAGQSAANLVVVKIGSDGQVVLSVSSTTHLVVDITGYYDTSGGPDPAGGFVPTDPNRLLDTRVGTGAVAQRVQAGSSVPLQVTGRGGVPAAGVSAVVMNVTAVEPSGAGWVTASVSGAPVPGSSNLNYAPGEVVPNLVMVQLGTDGKAVLTVNGTGSVDLLADVAGYFTDGDPVADGGFVPTAPSRVLDTRSATGGHNAIVSGGQQVSVSIVGSAGLPSSGVSAVVVNLTATQPTGGGFLTAYATGASVPGTSNLNYSEGKSAAVLAIVPVGADGSITMFAQGAAEVHLLADVMGYIPDAAATFAGGQVYVWGANASGQAGDGTTTNRVSPYLIPDLPETTSVVNDHGTAYALTRSGEVYAWGSNDHGQVGDGTQADRLTPYLIPELSEIVSIFDRGVTTYALTVSGQVYAWGANTYGQVGDGTTTARLTPYLIPGLSDVVSVNGTTTPYAVTVSGQVYSWGRNTWGQVGDGSTTNRFTPYLMPGLSGVTSIFGDSSRALALTELGQVYSWGNNSSGQVGDGTTTPRLVPYLIPGLPEVASIVGGPTNIAVTVSGQVYTWGIDVLLQIGDEEWGNRLSPYLIPELSGVTSVVRDREVYAVTESGQVYSWGWNFAGQVGDGTTIERFTPYLIPELSDVAEIVLLPDTKSTYALTGSGEVYAWGTNGIGLIGDATKDPRRIPHLIPGLSGVTSVGGGGGSIVAVTELGEVYAWGTNGSGQVGDGTMTTRITPYLIPELNGISAVTFNGAAYAVKPVSD